MILVLYCACRFYDIVSMFGLDENLVRNINTCIQLVPVKCLGPVSEFQVPRCSKLENN